MSRMFFNDQNANFDWRSFDAYLFDIDGTLLNSRDAVHYHAFHHALLEVYGCDARIDNVPVHGNTDIGIMRAATQLCGIEEATFQKKLPAAIAALSAEVERNKAGVTPELCPSIPRLLADLEAAGKLMGVSSGNLEPVGWTKLRAAGIAQYFAFGSFSDRNETRTEIFRYGAEKARELTNPDATVCFVGDTPSDIQAAQALGLPVLAIATGVYSQEELEKYSPDLCVDCCDALWPAAV